MVTFPQGDTGKTRDKVAEAEEIKAIESERAKARQVEHGKTAPGRPKNTGGNIPTTPEAPF